MAAKQQSGTWPEEISNRDTGNEVTEPYSVTIQEQLARKERTLEELNRRLCEVKRLKEEICELNSLVQTKEREQNVEVVRNKREMKMIKQENSWLQLVCSDMERQIIEAGKERNIAGGSASVSQRSPLRIVEENVDYDNSATPREVESSWSCSKCTFLNSAFLNECEICGFSDFSRNADSNASDQQTSDSRRSSEGSCYCHHRP